MTHAGDVDRLSVRALFPQFVEAERTHGSLLRAFRARQAGPREPQADGVFRSLPGGLSELVRTLVQSLPPGMVQTATEVTGIRDQLPTRSSADAVESSPRFLVERATGTPVDARAVILAAQAFVTSALTRDYDADLSRLCGEIHPEPRPGDLRSAAASSRSTVMRTISEPARDNAATWAMVPSISAVSVLVIDCTTIGASPPMTTPPTATGTQVRREVRELVIEPLCVGWSTQC